MRSQCRFEHNSGCTDRSDQARINERYKSSYVNSLKMQGKSNWNKRQEHPLKARQFQSRKETQVTCAKCTIRGNVAEHCKTFVQIRNFL